MFGTEPMASTACVERTDAAVVAAHDHVAVLVALDRLGPSALQQLDAAPQEVVLEHRRDLGVLAGSTCWRLTTSVTLAAERGEHVDELHAGDAGADDGDALGEDLRRVAVAGGEDALAVGLAPVGDARARAGGDERGVELDGARRRRARRPATLVRAR